MAFIQLQDGRARFVSPEQGAIIWRVLNQEIKGTAKQRAFCKMVRRVYLNRENAPESWKQAYPSLKERFATARHKQMVTNVRLPYKD